MGAAMSQMMMPMIGGMAGGTGGFISGLRGTPDQQTMTGLGSKSKTQKELEQESMNQFQQQLALIGQLEQGMGGRQGVQGAAQGNLMGILGGQGFGVTPEEQQRIMDLRNAQVSQGRQSVQGLLEDNLKTMEQNMAARGLRGQAAQSLRGDVMNEAQRTFANQVAQADAMAAQNAINMPMQRLGLQGGIASNFANFADVLNQQAIQNRQMSQNPILMNFLNSQRQQVNTVPGKKGSFWDAVLGNISGSLGGMAIGSNMQSGMTSLGAMGGGGGSGGAVGGGGMSGGFPWTGGSGGFGGMV